MQKLGIEEMSQLGIEEIFVGRVFVCLLPELVHDGTQDTGKLFFADREDLNKRHVSGQEVRIEGERWLCQIKARHLS